MEDFCTQPICPKCGRGDFMIVYRRYIIHKMNKYTECLDHSCNTCGFEFEMEVLEQEEE